MLKKLWLLGFCLASYCATAQTVTVLPLNSNWRFRKAGDQQWMTAVVPGTVHTDLMANKMIPDPFYGSNEKNLQWIETCEWEYACTFDVPDSNAARRHCELVFEGLDTDASVYLNDSLILKANNMFRTWRISCRNILRSKNNKLLIVFYSAVNKGRMMAKMLPYPLPGDERVFTRKAQYQYGWDWGPRFVTCGIWRPVSIEMWDTYRISDIHIATNTFNRKIAEVTTTVTVIADAAEKIKLQVQNLCNSDETATKSFRLKPGINILSLCFTISNPQLWWCNGLGDPFMYPVKVVVNAGHGVRFEKVIPFGIRKIELVREHDSVGESFVFRLNGKNVFVKGANYIPPDNFMPRVDSSTYAAILNDALKCKMNMLRVWGGGNYESDVFYRLCDEKGIMIWQDLMFACAMYPGDSAFISNVSMEVADNIQRLRNHPCIALWCGNNEIDEGWHNWGWQKQYAYTPEDSSKIWNDYLTLFQDAIPAIVSANSPETPYLSSSPVIGWGHGESMLYGDSHYWGVWWGMEPFSVYETKVPRFMSEFGFQAMPDISTIKAFTDSAGAILFSDELKSHQKHPTGFETINNYMAREYPVPDNLEEYTYISQLLQAQGVKRAIYAQRRNMPRCMGSLYWQLNDCWPAISWSGRDYFGRWKALQYAIKDAYSELLISITHENNLVNVFLISDTTEANGSVELSLVKFDGTVLWTKTTGATAIPGSSQQVMSVPLSTVIPDSDLMRKSFIRAVFIPRNGYSRQWIGDVGLLTEPEYLELEKPDFDLKFRRFTGKFWEVTLLSGTFAKNVQLSFKETNTSFSDNFFDLLPNEKKTVQCVFEDDIDDPAAIIVIRSLYDVLQNNPESTKLK